MSSLSSDPSALVFQALVLPLLWCLPPLLVLLGARLLLPRWRGWQGERMVGRRLEALFPEVLHGVVLPDGRGGLTQIDHLALTPRGLLVVETKHYRGAIQGAAEATHWVQLIGRRRYPFVNPLHQNRRHVRAVEALGLGQPVHARVVFTDGVRFVDAVPAGVSRCATLARDLGALRGGRVGRAKRAAWARLRGQVRRGWLARWRHRRQVERCHGRDDRTRLGKALLGAAGALAGLLWWRVWGSVGL